MLRTCKNGLSEAGTSGNTFIIVSWELVLPFQLYCLHQRFHENVTVRAHMLKKQAENQENNFEGQISNWKQNLEVWTQRQRILLWTSSCCSAIYEPEQALRMTWALHGGPKKSGSHGCCLRLWGWQKNVTSDGGSNVPCACKRQHQQLKIADKWRQPQIGPFN